MLHIISTCNIATLNAARSSLSEDDDVVVFADILSDPAMLETIFAERSLARFHILFAAAKEETQAAFLAAFSQPRRQIDLDTFVRLSVKHACIITWQ